MNEVWQEVVVVQLKEAQQPLYYGGRITIENGVLIISTNGVINFVGALDAIKSAYITSIRFDEPATTTPEPNSEEGTKNE